MRTRLLSFMLLVSSVLIAADANATKFVSLSGNDGNTGDSWAQAYRTLQFAVNSAADNEEIWVAGGVYAEIRAGVNSDGSLNISKPVRLYGGFNGTETALSQRNFNTNLTAIDGSTSRSGFAAYTVVNVQASGAIVDGFRIRGGIADNGAQTSNERGGGLFVEGRTFTLRNCIVENNSARVAGGGMTIRNCFSTQGNVVTVEFCTFRNNSGNTTNTPDIGLGGGLNLQQTDALIQSCTFHNNTARYGGGIYTVWSFIAPADNQPHVPPRIWNCVFYANTAVEIGGGIHNHHSETDIRNCTFVDNQSLTTGFEQTSSSGGAIAVTNSDCLPRCGAPGAFPATKGSPRVVSCVVAGNGSGAQLYQATGPLGFQLVNHYETAAVPGDLFQNAAARNYRPNGSGAGLANIIDQANVALTNELNFDRDGTVRPLSGVTGSGGGVRDRGAYEYDQTQPTCNAFGAVALPLSTNNGRVIGLADALASPSTDGGTAQSQLVFSATGGFTASCATLGPRTVDVTVTDLAGNSRTCSTVFTVIDDVLPTLSLISDFTIDVGATPTTFVPADFLAAASTDNCGGAPTVTAGRQDNGLLSFSELDLTTNPRTIAVNVLSQDAAGNNNTGTVNVTIRDLLPPVVSVGAPAPIIGNQSTTFEFLVTITDVATVNLTDLDVTIDHNGTSGGVVTVLNGTTSSPRVQVSGVQGDGTFGISLAAGIAEDVAGNLSNAASSTVSASVDNTPPVVSIGAPSPAVGNSATLFSFPVTITGASSSNIVSADVNVSYLGGTTGGAITVINGTAPNPIVQIVGVTGGGSITISIDAGVAFDDAGNANAVSNVSPEATLNNDLTVITNPVSAARYVGDDYTLSVNIVGGSGNRRYFWSREPIGGGLPTGVGGDNPFLDLNNLTLANEGQYRVTVEDLGPGPETGQIVDSAYAVVTVRPAVAVPAPTVAPSAAVNTGANVTLTASPTGGYPPYTYVWRKGGSPIIGAPNSPTYTIPAAVTGDTGDYSVTVTDTVNSGAKSTATSAPTTLTVTDPLTAGLSLTNSSNGGNPTVYAGGSFELTATATGGTSPYTFTLFRGTTQVQQQVAVASPAVFNLNAVTVGDTGAYTVTVADANVNFDPDVTSSAVNLTVVENLAITGVTQTDGGLEEGGTPNDDVVNVGDPSTYTVATTGGIAPLSYDWQVDTGGGFVSVVNGVGVSGQGTATLVYTPQVGGVTLEVQVVVSDSGTPQTQTSTPRTLTVLNLLNVTAFDTTVYVGDTATLNTTTFAGIPPYTYNWDYTPVGGTPNPGVSTDEDLVISGIVQTQAGQYTVTVTDSSGGVNPPVSKTAVVTVVEPLNITDQPDSIIRYVGQSATFNVATTGGIAPLSYDWEYNSSSISGPSATAPFTIPSVTLADAGLYRVTVLAQQGDDPASPLGNRQETSNQAILSVVDAPVIDGITPATASALTTGPDLPFSISVTSGGFGNFSYAWFVNGIPVGPGNGDGTIDLDPGLVPPGVYTVTANVIDQGPGGATLTTPAPVSATVTIAAPVNVTLEAEEGVIGGDLTWTATVTGGLGTLSFQWFKDDGSKAFVPLVDDANISGSNTAALTITDLTLEDAGTYQIEVIDSADPLNPDTATATLTVSAGVPLTGGLGLAALAALTALGGAATLRRRR